MVLLSQEIKENVVRLLGYPDYNSLTLDQIENLDREFTSANVDRIEKIINTITREPVTHDDGSICGGGVDFQLDNAGIDSNVMVMDKLTFDHTGMIKRLRAVGYQLTKELSNIVNLPIHYNRYGSQKKRPTSFVSFPIG